MGHRKNYIRHNFSYIKCSFRRLEITYAHHRFFLISPYLLMYGTAEITIFAGNMFF